MLLPILLCLPVILQQAVGHKDSLYNERFGRNAKLVLVSFLLLLSE